jgi:hypothetical protein
VHVDPSRRGSEVVSAVADRIRLDFYRRIGLEELLMRRSSVCFTAGRIVGSLAPRDWDGCIPIRLFGGRCFGLLRR